MSFERSSKAEHWVQVGTDFAPSRGMATTLNARPRTEKPSAAGVSARSLWGLNTANFFLAEVTGVVLPFLNDFLKSEGWRYDAIGIATAVAGLGVFVMQAPAGIATDRCTARRGLLAASSIIVGLCYGLLPLVPAVWWIVDPLLLVSGMAQAFFAPLLGALALALVGYERLNGVIGANQSWNHAGNLAAALVAMLLMAFFPLASIFVAVLVVSVLAAGSLGLIRNSELDESRASGQATKGERGPGPWQLLRDRRIQILFAATALFHLANAPVMPLVALYVKHLHGTDRQVAAVVLVAQAVMVPVAVLTGWACNRWGRKPTFAIGFVVLPLRIVLYTLAPNASTLVWLQALDGIGAGIYGVAIVAICADLTHGRGGFNTLNGLIATALAIGGVLGPVLSGLLVQHLGFAMAFYLFAAIATAAALLFLLGMPGTRIDRA